MAKMTTTQAKAKLKAAGCTDAQLDAVTAKGISYVDLLAWAEKYAPTAVQAIEELIVILAA